jgi:hypothetical protein
MAHACKWSVQVFWSRECPLFAHHLPLFHRFAHSCSAASYLSSSLPVALLNIVPLVAILFGYFPIVLNLWTVIGITAFYAVLFVAAYQCTSWKHYQVCTQRTRMDAWANVACAQ